MERLRQERGQEPDSGLRGTMVNSPPLGWQFGLGFPLHVKPRVSLLHTPQRHRTHSHIFPGETTQPECAADCPTGKEGRAHGSLVGPLPSLAMHLSLLAVVLAAPLPGMPFPGLANSFLFPPQLFSFPRSLCSSPGPLETNVTGSQESPYTCRAPSPVMDTL